MFFDIDQHQQRRAKAAHELAMVNLLLLNLPIGIALLAGSMAQPDSSIAAFKWFAVAVPMLLSLAVMSFIRVRAGRIQPWFVAAHWRLSARRCRILLAAYLVSAAVLSLALFDADHSRELEQRLAALPPAIQQMERHKLESQQIGTIVWARISVVPLLLSVMALVMLESGALYQAGRGEMPDDMIQRFPPPDALPRSAEPVLHAD